MKHTVTKVFKDTESGELYFPNFDFLCEDYQRIQHLSSLGFIIPNSNTEKLNKQTEVKEEVKEEKKPQTRKTTSTRAKKTSDA